VKYSWPNLYSYSNANCAGSPDSRTDITGSCDMTPVQISASSVSLTSYGSFAEINPSATIRPTVRPTIRPTVRPTVRPTASSSILPPNIHLNSSNPNNTTDPSQSNDAFSSTEFHKTITFFVSVIMIFYLLKF
jgi:hypothetical protein